MSQPAYVPYTALNVNVEEAYFLGCVTQSSLILSGFVLGKTYRLMPKTNASIGIFLIALISVLHAGSICLGVYATNLVGSIVPVYDSSPYLYKYYPGLQKLGGYTWTSTGIVTDYMVALLTVRKLLYVLSANRIFIFSAKKQWYLPHIGAFFFSFPGIMQTVWVYFALVEPIAGVTYQDSIGKYMVFARLFLIKGTDIIFFIELYQFAQLVNFDRTKLFKLIPKTIEAAIYYLLSTGLVIYYLWVPNAQVARLFRNLCSKGTEVATFLYLYYASIKEIQEQYENSRTGASQTEELKGGNTSAAKVSKKRAMSSSDN